MNTKTLVIFAFVLGAAAGAVATWSVGPQASEARRIDVRDIEGLENFIRNVAETCVIVGAGSSMAHLVCHLESS